MAIGIAAIINLYMIGTLHLVLAIFGLSFVSIIFGNDALLIIWVLFSGTICFYLGLIWTVAIVGRYNERNKENNEK